MLKAADATIGNKWLSGILRRANLSLKGFLRLYSDMFKSQNGPVAVTSFKPRGTVSDTPPPTESKKDRTRRVLEEDGRRGLMSTHPEGGGAESSLTRPAIGIRTKPPQVTLWYLTRSALLEGLRCRQRVISQVM